MKKLFLAAVTALSLFSCEDNDQNPNVLPLATQTGKNTGGALVDGQVWVAKIQNSAAGAGYAGGQATVYEYVNSIYKLQVVLNQVNDTSNRIKFSISDTEKITTKTYYTYAAIYENHLNTYNVYNGTNDNVATITITKFDIEKQIVSGTFSFEGKNTQGKIVNITQGRFDKKFVN